MLKIKDKNKVYDFKYKINWIDGKSTTGEITNSSLPPEVIFLMEKITYFSNGTCTYFNRKEIKSLGISNLVEKVEVSK